MSRRGFSLTKTLSTRFFSTDEKKGDDSDDDDNATNANTPSFISSTRGPQVAAILEKYASKIHDDSFLKIVRQLEFWHTNTERDLSDEEFLALTERLAKIASWRENVDDVSIPEEEKLKIPKVRFGRTELQMPIITCGGMRIQETWIPDTVPLLKPNKSKVVKSASQDNLKDVILCCLKVGLNHFETARFYGSSEVQFVDALCNLIDEGKIKRSDFIFQTKIGLLSNTKTAEFAKFWANSWTNVSKLGYVDLFAFHCMSLNHQLDNVLSDDADDGGVYKFALDLQKEGKIRHIGFSTHGCAQNILRMIDSNKFSFVNLHKHYFGDYHAAGTSDLRGGQGNAECVRRALELDMGVFNISPFDKGGKLYRPSASVANAVGCELSPIAFAALHAWKVRGMHTVSVGLARSSDLDEVIEAARLYREDERARELVRAAEGRLEDLTVRKLGKEWCEKGLLNLPTFYDESTDGMAIGNMLWLYNCMASYGMIEFAKDRYNDYEKKSAAWSKSKSFEENLKSFDTVNPGRSFDESVDLTKALSNHYDPELAKAKLAEVHNWLTKDATLSEEEKVKLGWKQAYNLTTWEEFPGDDLCMSGVILRRMGIKSSGGNIEDAVKEAKVMRGIVRKSSLLSLED